MRCKVSNHAAFIIAIGLMAVFALLREVLLLPRLDSSPNSDSGWLLYAAGRMLDGAKPYVDMMETNPPLILWISLIPAGIARVLHISPMAFFPYFVTVFIMTGIIISANSMRKISFLREKKIYYPLILFIAAGLFLFTPDIYGQREVLFVCLVLPYLIKSLGEEDEGEKNTAYNVMIAIMAAVGFAIKPYFIALWIANELYKALQRRNFRSLFTLENWIIGIFQIVYLASIYFYMPGYYSVIMPMVFATYFPYEATWQRLVKIGSFIAIPPIILFWMSAPHGNFRKIIARIIIWVLACSVFIIFQRKDWVNHLYPMLFMSGLAVVMVISYLLELWGELEFFMGRRRLCALLLAIGGLAFVVYSNARITYHAYKHPSVIHQRLLAEIDKHASGKIIYPLSFNLQSAFPVIGWSKGIFLGSFYQMWPLYGIIIREQEEHVTPDVAKARQDFYDGVVHDFSSNPPDFVWVDDNVNLEKAPDKTEIEPENRDIIKVLARDVRFAVLWQNYEKIGEVEGEEPKPTPSKDGKIYKAEHYSLYERIKK